MTPLLTLLRSCNQVIMQDGLMPHRYLRQHQPLLLPLLLLPHLALVHSAVEDSLGLHAVFVHLAVRSNCPDEQR